MQNHTLKGLKNGAPQYKRDSEIRETDVAVISYHMEKMDMFQSMLMVITQKLGTQENWEKWNPSLHMSMMRPQLVIAQSSSKKKPTYRSNDSMDKHVP